MTCPKCDRRLARRDLVPGTPPVYACPCGAYVVADVVRSDRRQGGLRDMKKAASSVLAACAVAAVLYAAGTMPVARATAGVKTEAVYRNVSGIMVPPDKLDHYTLTPVTALSDVVTGWAFGVSGGKHQLESTELRAACWLAELPAGSVLADPSGLDPAPANVDTIKASFVFTAPSTVISYPPVFPPDPYVLDPGKEMFLVSQFRNTGDVGTPAIGPYSCVAFVYYRVPY